MARDIFLCSHKLLGAHLLPEPEHGKFRRGNMVVMKHNKAGYNLSGNAGTSWADLFDRLWEDTSFIHPCFRYLLLLKMETGVLSGCLYNGLLRTSWERKPGIYRARCATTNV